MFAEGYKLIFPYIPWDLSEMLKYETGVFHKKLLHNSYFQPYWSIIKPTLHKAINGLFYKSHKLFYRFILNWVLKTSVKNYSAISIFTLIDFFIKPSFLWTIAGIFHVDHKPFAACLNTTWQSFTNLHIISLILS